MINLGLRVDSGVFEMLLLFRVLRIHFSARLSPSHCSKLRLHREYVKRIFRREGGRV